MHRTFIRPARAKVGASCLRDRRRRGASPGLAASFLALGFAVVGCGGGGGTKPPPGTDGGTTGGEGNGPGTSSAPTCTVKTDTVLAPAGAASPAIAYGGGHFAVAWADAAGGGGAVHLAVVDDSGKMLGDQVLSAAGGASQQPDVTALPDGGFLVTWQEIGAGAGGVVRARRVGADGTPREDAFAVKATAGADARPSEAARAGDTDVAWADMGSVHVGELMGSALANEQTVPNAGDPALAAARDGFGLAFTAGPRLGFARLSTPLHDVSPVLFRSAPGRANVPRIAAASDGSFAYVWEDVRAGEGNEAVYLVRIGDDGKPSDEARVSSDAGSADYPDVAFVGRYAAVVYYQYRSGPPSIYLTLVGPDRERAGEDVQISDKGARFPRIAGSGGTLGVAYAEIGGPAKISVVDCR